MSYFNSKTHQHGGFTQSHTAWNREHALFSFKTAFLCPTLLFCCAVRSQGSACPCIVMAASAHCSRRFVRPYIKIHPQVTPALCLHVLAHSVEHRTIAVGSHTFLCHAAPHCSAVVCAVRGSACSCMALAASVPYLKSSARPRCKTEACCLSMACSPA